MGLKIRGVNDTSPPLITGNTSAVINVEPPLGSTNVINRLWKMVMDKVTDMMDCVMDESIGSDECNESDGIFQKSPELENSIESKLGCNTNKQGQKDSKVINNEFSQMPSCYALVVQVAQLESQTDTEHEVEDNSFAITVGDLVTILDCPGDWCWASPFKVTAIEGNWVALELVDELIEMSRLQKCRT